MVRCEGRGTDVAWGSLGADGDGAHERETSEKVVVESVRVREGDASKVPVKESNLKPARGGGSKDLLYRRGRLGEGAILRDGMGCSALAEVSELAALELAHSGGPEVCDALEAASEPWRQLALRTSEGRPLPGSRCDVAFEEWGKLGLKC